MQFKSGAGQLVIAKFFRAMKWSLAALLLAAVFTVGALVLYIYDSPLAINDCEAKGPLTPFCGLQAPEDIEVWPGSNQLILSQYGGMEGENGGGLALFDPVGGTSRKLAPYKGDATWGQPGCEFPRPEQFSPHGIHVRGRRLLAVNHGREREAVEFFELLPGFNIAWRGCVTFSEAYFLNDVVNYRDGLLASHMFDKGDFKAIFRAEKGENTGFVVQWQPGSEPTPLEGSEAPFPNGIQITSDERTLFQNFYTSGGAVRRLHITTGKEWGRVPVPNPDNASWSPEGKLLVASHAGAEGNPFACQILRADACGQHFQIVEIDPTTLEANVIFEHAGPPMGAATIAVEQDGYLYMGSYASDRLLRAPSDFEN